MNDIITAAFNGNAEGVSGALFADPSSIKATEPKTQLTALHIAAGQGHIRIVEMLLAQPNVDLKALDAFGRDPLELAISLGQENIIEAISRRMYPKSFAPDA